MVVWDPLGSQDEMSREGPGFAFGASPGTFQGVVVPTGFDVRGSRTEITGTVFDDIADAVASAGDWMSHAVTNAVDAIKTIPGIGFLVEQIDDFAKTAVGRVFMAALGPGILTEFFTAIPGVGMQIASTLSTLGPVATQMLPGLVRGEPVDKVFVQSVKDVVSRASAAGGAPPVLDGYVKTSLQVVSDKLKSLGIDPAKLTESISKVPGLPASGLADKVPTALREEAAKKLQPYLDQLSRASGVPTAFLQTALDGLTRTTGYNSNQYDARGNLVPLQQQAANMLDSWILQPYGQRMSIVLHGATPIPTPVGGTYRNTGDVLSAARAHAKDFGGAMGRLADENLIRRRILTLARAGKRPPEAALALDLSKFRFPPAVPMAVYASVPVAARGPVDPFAALPENTPDQKRAKAQAIMGANIAFPAGSAAWAANVSRIAQLESAALAQQRSNAAVQPAAARPHYWNYGLPEWTSFYAQLRA